MNWRHQKNSCDWKERNLSLCRCWCTVFCVGVDSVFYMSLVQAAAAETFLITNSSCTRFHATDFYFAWILFQAAKFCLEIIFMRMLCKGSHASWKVLYFFFKNFQAQKVLKWVWSWKVLEIFVTERVGTLFYWSVVVISCWHICCLCWRPPLCDSVCMSVCLSVQLYFVRISNFVEDVIFACDSSWRSTCHPLPEWYRLARSWQQMIWLGDTVY